MNESDIKKAIHQTLSALPNSKFMLSPDFQVRYEGIAQDLIKNHEDIFLKVVNDLSNQKIIFVEQINPVMARFGKGLHFDKLEAIVNSQKNNPSINIANFNATHAQVGNQNATMNIGMTPDDLIKVLNELLAKKPEEAKTIMDKLSDMAANGANITTLLTGLSGLL